MSTPLERSAIASVSGFDLDARSRDQVLARLNEAAPFDRSAPSHITVSAICFSHDLSQFTLVWHEKLARWLQPGGHVESHLDISLQAGSLRELLEETSLDAERLTPLSDGVFDIDIHELPNSPCKVHMDVRYAFRAADSALPAAHERWCSAQQAIDLGYPGTPAHRFFTHLNLLDLRGAR